jgi:hypothetical protein
MSANGTVPIVSVHVFTYRSPRAAARSLARDRTRLAHVPGLRFARLVFVGARRWECMTPGWIDPRRQMAMCVWDDEAALERFCERSPAGRSWREQTNQHCDLRMAPFRAHGTYRGEEPLAGLPAGKEPIGPIAMLTFANLPARGLFFFYRGINRSASPLLASNGLIAAVAGPERLGRGGMTFTIWDSLADALAFSYRRDPHRELVKDVHEHDRFIDSMFLRLRPYRAEGSWFPWSRFVARFEQFARSMPSAPAPAPPATTLPVPASRSPKA